MPAKKDFWEYVNKTDTCWNWTGPKRLGYGRLCRMGKMYSAHRLSYTMCVGDIPDGMKVLHKCDNASCVRPDHLFLGTQADNVKDCIEKGRRGVPTRMVGEMNPMSKITNEQALAIRSALQNGRAVSELARSYNMSTKNIYRIATSKRWSGIVGETPIVFPNRTRSRCRKITPGG